MSPCGITERIGELAYKLALPVEMSKLHNVFHVLMLWKYLIDPSLVLEEQSNELKGDLSYTKQHIEILGRQDKVLRNQTIPLVKVCREAIPLRKLRGSGKAR